MVGCSIFICGGGGGLRVQVSSSVAGCLGPIACLGPKIQTNPEKELGKDFGEGTVAMGTNTGLRRARAHIRKGGGTEPVNGDVKRSG